MSAALLQQQERETASSVYALQGGGYGKFNQAGDLVFFIVPDDLKHVYEPGDKVPSMWDYQGPFDGTGLNG